MEMTIEMIRTLPTTVCAAWEASNEASAIANGGDIARYRARLFAEYGPPSAAASARTTAAFAAFAAAKAAFEAVVDWDAAIDESIIADANRRAVAAYHAERCRQKERLLELLAESTHGAP